jgi:hypothetical protein
MLFSDRDQFICLWQWFLLISRLYFSPFFHMAHIVANSFGKMPAETHDWTLCLALATDIRIYLSAMIYALFG